MTTVKKPPRRLVRRAGGADGRLIPKIPWLRVLLVGIVFVTALALAFLIGAGLMRQVTVPGAMTAAIVLIMLALFGKGLTQGSRAAWASYLFPWASLEPSWGSRLRC